jgi:hypothetical protein
MARETPQQKQAREARDHRTDRAEQGDRVAKGRDTERAEGSHAALRRRTGSNAARRRY